MYVGFESGCRDPGAIGWEGIMTTIGIIGAGFMGGTHARALRAAGARIRGVVTRDAATCGRRFASGRDRHRAVRLPVPSDGPRGHPGPSPTSAPTSSTWSSSSPRTGSQPCRPTHARCITRILPRDPAVIGDEARRLSVVPAGHPMGYLDAFRAFLADTYTAVAGEQSHGLPTFADGARAALITEAVLRSAESRAWEEIGPATS